MFIDIAMFVQQGTIHYVAKISLVEIVFVFTEVNSSCVWNLRLLTVE